jgi:hypothetical protein
VARATSRRWLRRLALVLLATIAADQLVQWTLLRDGRVFGRRVAPYDPPLFTPDQEAVRERFRAAVQGGQPLAGFAFDGQLGWSVPADGGRGELRFDWAGARIASEPLARVKRPGSARIVALGDSFTLGDEVGAAQSWPAELGRLLPEVELANLGMNAYGLDQSLLRLERDGFGLAPDEVWLGFVPSTLLRVVTEYVPAWRHVSTMLACKPRFRLRADGELGECVHACDSLPGLLELLDDTGRLAAACADDHWIARTPAAYAPRGSHWTHFFASSRIALTLFENGSREPAGWYADPASEPVALVRAIARRAARECAAHRARFTLLLLPDRGDLRSRGGWSAVFEGLDVFDASSALLAAGALENDRFWAARGHYSAEGNRVVAAALAERWRARR